MQAHIHLCTHTPMLSQMHTNLKSEGTAVIGRLITVWWRVQMGKKGLLWGGEWRMLHQWSWRQRFWYSEVPVFVYAGALQGYRQRSGHVLAFVIFQLNTDLVVLIISLTSNHPLPYLPSILTLHVFSSRHPFPFHPSISRFISSFLICPSSLSSFNFVFCLLLLLAIFFLLLPH